MHYKLELDERQIPVLGLLHNLMTESLNELGFSIAEDLTTYSLIRAFTIIKIIGKDRTTIIKNIKDWRKSRICFTTSLSYFPALLTEELVLRE